jgi:DNA-binding NarL/FixJ family response regulator
MVMGKTAISVLVVRNKTPLFTDVLSKVLDSESSIHLLSQPVTVEGALDICRRDRPDVVLLEATDMPEGSVSRFVRSLAQISDGVPVILLADAQIDDTFLVAGVEAGAYGIVDATAGIGEVVGAVQAAAAGQHVVDPERFLSAVERTARARLERSDRAKRAGQLTTRELEVLAGLARGLSNAAIAELLSISHRTVDKHVGNILRKLNVSSRLQAVALFAKMEGLTQS